MLKNGNIIFDIRSEQDFQSAAITIFNYQYENNNLYRQWVDLIQVKATGIKSVESIPFLPIEFFKQFKIISGQLPGDAIQFKSSGTTSSSRSIHYVTDITLYEKSFLKCFELFYGNPKGVCFLALLPNYLERGDSSLVYMCQKLVQLSGHSLSGFFLNDIDELKSRIGLLKKSRDKVVLIGVSYALLDLCELDLNLTENFIVMETGGMKGTRKEVIKTELHEKLKNGFKINNIHSEYGMTELLSQAYSKKDGLFESPPWMRFLVREVDDPLKIRTDHKTGGINVIDLANLNSCAFIATKDLGLLRPDGKLELSGRYDHSDVRGCNLMVGNF